MSSVLNSTQKLLGVIVLFLGVSGCGVTQVEPVQGSSSDLLAKHFSYLVSSTQIPTVYQRKVRENGITELYLEGETFEQKSTRIFALYRASDHPLVLPSGKSPAVVLIHGGGGSAFEEWVKKWNEAGFAAISLAVEGQVDKRNIDPITGKVVPRAGWKKHAYPGPSRTNIYGDHQKPIQEQWMFHATSAAIRAKHYLASLDDIDANHIGLSGISWGGVITSTVMGFDPSFDFAIPIYGIGFLDSMQNHYMEQLQGNQSYARFWEPGLRIGQFSAPSLWLTGLKDKHFDLRAQAQTYNLPQGNISVSIKPDMRHGHGEGWRQAESYLFAQQVVLNQSVWAQPVNIFSDGSGNAQAQFLINLPEHSYSIEGAIIYYTNSIGHTTDAQWITHPANVAKVNQEGTDYVASYQKLPSDVTHWFINLDVNVRHRQNKGRYLVSSKFVSPKN